MCGLVAGLAVPGYTISNEHLAAAVDCMAPRGPDARGVWDDEGVALGHRRLAILDLDARSHQPMISASGRYAIAFNGEIYNFRELRSQLERDGVAFRTTSDTEVLLELFERRGEAMLPLLRGMFALVIWDRHARRGFVARDPYGIKPLYYAATREGVLLASQVKALLATGRISREPDAHGQAGFWLLGSVPEPHTWFRHIRAVPAGHSMWVDRGVPAAPRCWWDIASAWRDAPRSTAPVDDVREQVREALQRAVAAHLVADVPVGVFLSGGIDSGALAGMMVEAGATRMKGVTLGFREFAGHAQDETPVAARIAAHYGIEHHVRTVTRDEFTADLPRILASMDQPSVDGVNTWYASKAVAELGLKVVVSGVGGDELFQGYSSFRKLPRLVKLWRALSALPGAMTVADGVAALQAGRSGNRRWREVPALARSVAGAWWMNRSLFARADLPALMGPGLATELGQPDVEAWVESMTGRLAPDPRLALGQIESATYLRNQLLRDSDWASMAHSVELRTPLVDAWLLRELGPLLSRFADHPNKILLAEAPRLPLPADVITRPKSGFGIPMGRWLSEGEQRLPGGAATRSWSRQLVSSYALATA